MGAKKKKTAQKKKTAPKKAAPKKAAPKKAAPTHAAAKKSALKLKTYPEGEEEIDLVCETKMPNKRVPYAEISPTGRFVVAADGEGVCSIIDVELGSARDLAAPLDHVRFIAFLDREKVLIADGNGFVRVVELKSGVERAVLPARKMKDALLFHFVVAGGLAAYNFADKIGVFTWRDGVGEKPLDTKEKFNNIAIDGDTVYASLVGKKGKPATVKAWDARSGKETRTLTAPGDPFVASLLVVGPRVVAVTAETPTVNVWDESGTNSVTAALPGKSRVDLVTVLDDGKRIAVAQEDTLTLVNIVDGTMDAVALAPWRLSAAQGDIATVVDSRKRFGIYNLATRSLLMERAMKNVIGADLARDRVHVLARSYWGDIAVCRAHPPH